MPLARYHTWHLERHHQVPVPSDYPLLISGSTSSMVRPKLIWRGRDQRSFAITTQKSASSMRVLLADGTALKLTAEAQAVLQGWPVWYDWSVLRNYQALEIIGNSMPPRLSYYMIKHMYQRAC
jgi:site-specific DNA-cytosine methylase